ncbi:MAG: family 43 glycosylhydrolase [Clostridia bacterium]|nr:family 43 glycosylhydrolase [Clostridia bacterium]
MKQTPGLNPFLPFSVYVPDGEPKVFGDRLYLYGSYDRFGEGYCSRDYHVFSAPLTDLAAWEDHGVSFSTDAVPWSDALLYAPDALYHNGKYYLFFCLSDGTEGVAESDGPAGPFVNARQITLNGVPIEGIDPSVLEDDGKIYYTWGQFHLQMGELNDDLCTLRPETVRTDVLSNAPGREGFHEGSSLRKLGAHYCLIYASEYTDAAPNSGGRPTKLDYAVSASPYGPYTRRGTVIDNTGCDPASWNNHGSVLCAGGDWFVFYHASSNNTAFSRRARAERLTVDPAAGVIRQAVPSTNGFVKTLLPAHIVSPVHACRLFGGAYLTETPEGRFPCTALGPGAGFTFSPICFRDGGCRLTVTYRAKRAVCLEVLLGARVAAVCALPPQPAWSEESVSFSAVGGVWPLTLRIAQAPADADCAIDALQIIETKGSI